MTFTQKSVFFFILISFFSCESDTTATESSNETYRQIEGETMGTVYHITYLGSENYKSSIDSLLVQINAEVSVYEENALITQFNKSETGLELAEYEGEYFIANFEKAKYIHETTNGQFDPTVMPLVNYWGFGYTPRDLTQVDSLKVDSLLQRVGFDKVTEEVVDNGWDDELDPSGYREKKLDSVHFTKSNKATELDFGAIAKGYGVDHVGELLEENGVQNYLVEIGGEVRTKGNNHKGNVWTLAINTPKESAATTDYQAIIQLPNKGMATSGNYRNFHTIEGKKYSHTINPKTGFPEINSLLSVSVIAEDCMSADAYATAFMVMGLDRAFALASRLPKLEAYFIYGDEEGNMKVKYTEGVGEMLVDL